MTVFLWMEIFTVPIFKKIVLLAALNRPLRVHAGSDRVSVHDKFGGTNISVDICCSRPVLLTTGTGTVQCRH